MNETAANPMSFAMFTALSVAGGAALLVIIAEALHLRRRLRLAALSFGPKRRAARWTHLAPLLRVAGVFAVAWGLTILYLIPPKVHRAQALGEGDLRHIILVLDVSPSMRLEDAGKERKQPRMARASAVMESFFQRVPVEQYRMTVVAFYTDAKPVVEEGSDLDVVRNILSDLPMHHAFRSGETQMFAGLEMAAEIARPWRPRSTTVIVLSDGDTVPAVGMPKMPASVSHMVVVGIGDTRQGSFINGRQSRQDVSTLRQVAARLRGTYHNGNERHLPTSLLEEITQVTEVGAFEALTMREYALAAIGLGSLLLASLPLLLHYVGTTWRPGVPVQSAEDFAHRARSPDSANTAALWVSAPAAGDQNGNHQENQEKVVLRK